MTSEQGMPSSPSASRGATTAAGGWLLLLLAWAVATNSRTATLGLSPVLPLVIADLRLSYAEGGLLASLPLVLMGLFAVPGGQIADRFGVGRLVAGCTLLIALAGGLRGLAPGAPALFACTVLLGIAIGLLQPALPKLVRERFQHWAGLATAIYSSGFTAGGLIAAIVTGPVLLPVVGWSWRGVLLVWALPALLTGLLWLPLVDSAGATPGAARAPVRQVARDRLLWLLALLFVAQAAVFYTLSSWLPAVYHQLGWSLEAASVPLLALSVGTLLGGFVGPILSDRLRSRRLPLALSSLAALVGSLGLLLAPLELPLLWPFVAGSGVAATFTIQLAMPVDAARPEHIATFTGLMLSLGYGGTIVGPVVAGALRDATGSFSAGLAAVVVGAAAMLALVLLLPETYGRRGSSTHAAARAPMGRNGRRG